MAFFSQLLLLEVPRVSASISSTDKRIETRQPPLERVRFFLSCHVNNSISSFAAIRLVFQYWVTFWLMKLILLILLVVLIVTISTVMIIPDIYHTCLDHDTRPDSSMTEISHNDNYSNS